MHKDDSTTATDTRDICIHGEWTAEQMDDAYAFALEVLSTEYPNVKFTRVKHTAESMLRHDTREHAPEVDEAIAAGDLALAGERLRARLESAGAGG